MYFCKNDMVFFTCVFDDSWLKRYVYHRTISLMSNISIYVQQQIRQDQRSQRSKFVGLEKTVTEMLSQNDEKLPYLQ